MKKNSAKLTALLFAVFATVVILSSCSDDSGTSAAGEKGYIVYGSTEGGVGYGGASFMLQTPTLDEGTATFEGNGADITSLSGLAPYLFVYKGGFVYTVDTEASRFVKYKLENNQFNLQDEFTVSFGDNTIIAYQWLSDDNLLMFFNETSYKGGSYALVNVNSMETISSGKLPIPAPTESKTLLFLGTGLVKDGKLFVGYANYPNDGVAADDTARIAIMDYPSLSNVVIRTDTRATAPGGGLASTPGYVIDEKGDLYIKCNSGEQGGNNPTKPSAVIRIKKGETVIDPTYFFNTSELTDGAWQQGLWYLGNGKAITKSFKGLYYSASNPYIWQYHVIDLAAKTVTKIDVPGSYLLNFRNEVLLEDGKAYFAVNAETDGIHIYSYDLATGKVTKGLQIQAVDGIQAFFKEDDLN